MLVAWPGVEINSVLGAENVVVEAPTFKVGNEWRYSNGSVRQVVGFKEDYVITVSKPGDSFCQDCRYFKDKNLTVMKVLDSIGKPYDYSVTGWKTLDFPRHAGKAWSYTMEGRLGRGSRALLLFRNQFKAIEYEAVSVKAGTFNAFRIRHHQESLRGGGSGDRDLWYAPDVRAFIKQAVYAALEAWGGNWELESYTRQ